MTQEIWKDVVGYEGRYKVSNLGRVADTRTSVEGNDGRPIYNPAAICVRKNYYTLVYLVDEKDKMHTFHVDRVVAMAFIPNPDNFTLIEHIDGNLENDKADNIKWKKKPKTINGRWVSVPVSQDTVVKQCPVVKEDGTVISRPELPKEVLVAKVPTKKRVWNSIRVVNVETGVTYNSMKECCRVEHIGQKTLKKKIDLGLYRKESD